MPGQLYVFSAPSGAGKTTIIDSLKNRMGSMKYSVSHTSRKPRDGEKDGVHYHFVNKDVFRGMIEDGMFVEWAEVYGNLYGTSFSSLDEKTSQGLDVLLDLDHQGAKNIIKHYENTVLIYVLPPSLEILENRLRTRGAEDENILKTRLNEALNDIKNCVWYDYIIINDDLEKAKQEARSIIISQRCRASYQAPQITGMFGFQFSGEPSFGKKPTT